MSRRRRVTHSQLENLCEILSKNKSLATEYNKSAQAREYSKRMWMKIETGLNSHGDGAVKDWKGWCKYWNDYKSKLKSKAAGSRASFLRTGGGPGVNPLNDLEKRFLQILGDDFAHGIIGIQVEPDLEEVEPPSQVPFVAETDETYAEDASESILHDNITLLLVPSPSANSQGIPATTPPVAGPSTWQPAPLTSQPLPLPQPPPCETSPDHSAIPPPPTTPTRHTPRSPRRRRRVTRREPPVTQEMARRTLIQLSERSVSAAERNNSLLEKLVREMESIKNIINSRLVCPPRDGE